MKLSLTDYMSSYHDFKDYQQTFYVMDKTLKYIHENNYKVYSFNPDNIFLLNNSDNKTTAVSYQNVVSIGDKPVDEVHQDMFNLALLEVSIYTSTYPYLKADFLRENFKEISMLLPNEDISYYRRNLLEKNYFYYSDYCDARNKNDIEKINKSLEAEGGRSRSMVKSTPYGAIYQEIADDNSKAFVTRFILPFIIFSLSLLIPLLSIILA
ncbi:hypothetical protein EGP98_06215 [bacterium]|nr:hypothetical protein [bacterium]